MQFCLQFLRPRNWPYMDGKAYKPRQLYTASWQTLSLPGSHVNPFLSLQKAQVKSLASLPPAFVSENLAYFADVKAYELEEESPQPEGDQHFETEIDDQDFDPGLPEFGRQRMWRLLEAVVEEEVAEGELEGKQESAVQSERRSHGAEALKKVLLEDDVQQGGLGTSGRNEEGANEERPLSAVPEQETRPTAAERESTADVPREEKSELGALDAVRDESVRRLVFEDIPANIPRARRTSPTELARARFKALASQEALTVADASEELQMLSLKENVTQREENLGLLAKKAARFSIDGARRQSRRRSSLAKHGRVAREPETPLQAILRACGQETMPSLNEFISKF
jgi:hypothetical protein